MLAVLHLWLVSYGRVAVVLSLALSLGYPASRNILRGPAAPLLAVLVGLALLSLGICLLGWLRVFSGLSVALLGGIGGLVSFRCLWLDVPRWRLSARRARVPPAPAVSVAVLLAALLGFSLLTLYPPSDLSYDATLYHLPLARDLVHHHGLVYDPFVRYSFFPQANESLFAVTMLLSPSPVSSSALEFAVLSLAVLAMPLWFAGAGRRAVSGLVAGLLVLASPVVIWVGTAAWVDAWTLVFVAAAVLVGLDAAEGRSPPVGTLLLAGLLLGEAAATKYTGLVFGACAFLGVLIAGRSRIRPIWLAAPLAGVLAVAAPWYAWTFHTTGDPLYPFAVGIFGNRHGLWTSSEISFQDFIARGGIKAGVASILRRDVQYLRGLIPYNTGPGRSPLSWLLGVCFLSLLAPSAWRERTLVGTALSGMLCLVLSLFISADPRYLVPAVGVLAICGGLATDWGLDAIRRKRRRGWPRSWKRLAHAGCVLAAVPLLWSSAAFARDFWSTNGSPPTSAARIDAFVAQHVPCYPAIAYLNRHAGSTWRAWASGCDDAHYYARGVLIDDVFSTGSVVRVFNGDGTELPDPRTLWSRLAPLRVQWMLLAAARAPDPRSLERGGLFTLYRTVSSIDIFRVRSFRMLG